MNDILIKSVTLSFTIISCASNIPAICSATFFSVLNKLFIVVHFTINISAILAFAFNVKFFQSSPCLDLLLLQLRNNTFLILHLPCLYLYASSTILGTSLSLFSDDHNFTIVLEHAVIKILIVLLLHISKCFSFCLLVCAYYNKK